MGRQRRLTALHYQCGDIAFDAVWCVIERRETAPGSAANIVSGRPMGNIVGFLPDQYDIAFGHYVVGFVGENKPRTTDEFTLNRPP